jgi:ribose transport system substrate-binding protein
VNRKPFVHLALGAAVSTLVLAGCSSKSTSTAGDQAAPQNIPPCAATQSGPDGQTATSAKTLSLSAAEVAKFKALNRPIRVATFWQAPAANNTLMRQGMKAAWSQYGLKVDVVSQTEANFDAPTQASQIETSIGLKPDAMIGILVDSTSERPAIEKVNAAKIPIIFWDVSAGGGTQYTSIVTSNGQQAGCLAADALATALHGKGDIAVFPMAFAFYPTDQRVAGFVQRIKTEHPGMHIVSTMGATVEADGISKGQGVLQRYPSIKGMFASWVDPAMGLLQAAKTLGRTDVAVTTVDLADQDATVIASCGQIKAAATQLPYDEGFAEGVIMAKALIGETVPQYVVTDTPIATHDTLMQVYSSVYHAPPSSAVTSAFKKSC